LIPRTVSGYVVPEGLHRNRWPTALHGSSDDGPYRGSYRFEVVEHGVEPGLVQDCAADRIGMTDQY
jgi:hypothetical protein